MQITKNLQKCYKLLTRSLTSVKVECICKLYITTFFGEDSSAERSYDKPDSNCDCGLFCRYLMQPESKR